MNAFYIEPGFTPSAFPTPSGLGRADLAKTIMALDHHAIVSIADRQGVITHVNDRFCAISGYERDELIGQRHSILKSGRHDAALYKDLWTTITAGRVWQGVICNRRKNGGVYWVQSTIMPIADDQGEIQEFVSVRTDITDRVQAQAHSSLLSQVLNQTEECVVVMDLDGRVVYANRAVEQALGFKASHMQGRQFAEFLPPALRRRCQMRLQNMRTCDFRWQGQLTMVREGGDHFISLSRVGVVANAAGLPTYVFNLFSDYAGELKRQADLRYAKECAEQASAAKSIFLSHVSHELRTPLNAVMGFAQLLAMGVGDARHASFAREILTAGRHLVCLIDDMLDLTKIESGHDALTMTGVDLAHTIGECVSLVQAMADARRISLATSLPEGALRVKADAVRLKQVLLNLLSNAIKYSHEMGDVCLRVVQPGNGRIRVSISDKGIGIKPEQLPSLFEPFNRLDAASRGIEGTGIGLAISKKLVEKMAGTIGVSSEQGQGSTFWIELDIFA